MVIDIIRDASLATKHCLFLKCLEFFSASSDTCGKMPVSAVLIWELRTYDK
jgi:hypothetical protein